MDSDTIVLAGSIAAILELGFWAAVLYVIYRYNAQLEDN